MNTDNKIYQATDFARYYAGTMPAVDMHALEKAALEDPFLADALEGYALTMNGVNETVGIKKLLFQDAQKSMVVSKYDFKFFLRIAAVLIFIGVAGYFYYLVNRNTSTVSLVQEEQKKKSETAQSQKTLTETATINNKAARIDAINPTNQNSKELSLADNRLSTEPPTPASTQAEKISQQVQRAKRKQKDLNVEDDPKTFFTQSGSVQDLKGAPLAAVTIKDKNSNYGTTTDELGHFNLKTFDSNATVTVSSVGFSQKEIVLNNNAPQKITLQDAQQSLSEVVVMGYSTKRKKSAISGASTSTVSNTLEGKVAGVNIQNSKSANSVTDRKNVQTQAFDSVTVNQYLSVYISKNKIPLFEDRDNPIKGTVTVSYLVDELGKLKNIQILSSSCARCSAQIVKLLSDAPPLKYRTPATHQITFTY